MTSENPLPMKILLTGGTGYIGSHTAVALLEAGHEVLLADNLSNSKAEVVARIKSVTGRDAEFHQLDLCNYEDLLALFKRAGAEAVIHFAGLKAVGESVAEPLRYYQNNLVSSMNLCRALLATGMDQLVFSSSATVYGEPESVPISETAPALDASSPYGRTKLFIERILEDVARANPALKVALLRYFNPAGAHASGMMGEDPTGMPNNLLPYVCQVAVGRRERLTIFGDDYPTRDGTCIRDYIHVMDLAAGHEAALDYLQGAEGLEIFNLGTGEGHTVLELVKTFEEANQVVINRELGARRPGDVPASYTDPARAQKTLKWRAQRSLTDICQDAWNWQRQNPEGY